MLDAVLSPNWGDRYYSCDSRWAPGEVMSLMRDGSGNAHSIVFAEAGVFARGFNHESILSRYRRKSAESWPGLLDGVPEATVCFWPETADAAWCGDNFAPGPDGGGAAALFQLLLDGSPEVYQSFAEDCHETDLDLHAVRHVYVLRPFASDVVRTLNPKLELAELAGCIAEVGYRAGM
ncbi:hypothetical protein KSE_71680 [Kitasatospora setae KM-6054]|uniref:Uncharacterized protein n=2 Tax=Streptomycetaceae TaxID=2062 RepID=E4NIX6_KITSK|nr:hypothetical protein KSE_71680 [Kitasatospora setae KM-6054]